MSGAQAIPEMRDDLRKGALYCDLGLANVRNVSFETSNPPEGAGELVDEGECERITRTPNQPPQLDSPPG